MPYKCYKPVEYLDLINVPKSVCHFNSVNCWISIKERISLTHKHICAVMIEEASEMKILREETSTKILNAVKDVVLSEQIEFRVSKWDIASNVISILFRLFTVLFNIYLACEYHSKGEFLFFKLTLCFILIPAIISIALSITL